MRAGLTGSEVTVVSVEGGWLIPCVQSMANGSSPNYGDSDSDDSNEYGEHEAECAAASDMWRDAGYRFGNGEENEDSSIMDGWREATRYG